jgi:hypothetical protein
MRLTPSLKNTKSPNSAIPRRPINRSLKRSAALLGIILAGHLLSSCEATYPARTLTSRLTQLIKEEEKLNVTCHITGKTLWVYVPLEDLIDEKELTWNAQGFEKISKVIAAVHRVLLSSDAQLNFIGIVGTDIKKYGVELTAIEYVPDFKEAVLERFSRGEFFSRSVRNVSVNSQAIDDLTGESKTYYDITFPRFLGLQIIHRVKNLFAKDEALAAVFDLKSTASSDKFGIVRVDLEFIQKTYELTPEQEAIDPLEYTAMIAAQVTRNYDFKDIQAVELYDTFSERSRKLTLQDLKKMKIDLPRIDE